MRKQAGFLKYISQRPAVRGHEPAGILPDIAVEAHRGARGALESGNAAQDRRLAGTGAPEQRRNPLAREFAIDLQLEIRA